MKYGRKNQACTIFQSLNHDGHHVILTAGGDGSKEAPFTAEILDFSIDTNQWDSGKCLITLTKSDKKQYFPNV